MFEQFRDRMREKIRSLEYAITLPDEKEMENDSLSVFDVEPAILNF